MEIFSFFGGVWASIIVGVLFAAMVVGCSLDRHGSTYVKWWIVVGGLILGVIWFWNDISFDLLRSSDFWTTIGLYLLIGIGYSIIEFVLEVRRSVLRYTKQWESFKARYTWGKDDHPVTTAEVYHNKKDMVESFVQRYRGGDDIVTVAIASDNTTVEPVINRRVFGDHIGCWTTLWPFYAVSLVFGDLLSQISRLIADVFAKISGRAVRMAFKNVFKI